MLRCASPVSITCLLLISCSSNYAKNVELQNQESSTKNNTLQNQENNDSKYVKEIHQDILNVHNKQNEQIKRFNMENYLNTIDSSIFVTAGKLNCKAIENNKPEENELILASLPQVARDYPYPLAYKKVREYLNTQIKVPENDLDYSSLSDTDQIIFLAVFFDSVVDSTLRHSIDYYCPDKKPK